MSCFCQIVPQSVLKRFADDPTLTKKEQAVFHNTALLDTELRKLRTQAAKVAKASLAMAPAVRALAAAPSISVFDCAHGTTLPGAPVADPGNSADATAKHATEATQALVKFYAEVFKRNSIDDGGMTLLSSLHYGVNYNNAFWNGSQMTYGDGDGGIFVDFTQGNDVIGHEITHGITQHTLRLSYVSEAGGLNESLSDCFGSMFRQWQAKQDVDQADWLIGKDIMGPKALDRGLTCLRDLADPAAAHCLSPQPTHFSQFETGMDPHTSSGIPNLAFYTICKAVRGNSWDKVGQVWYRTLTGSGAKPVMKMKAFANRTRAVAGELYPGDTALSDAVDAGWQKVGL